MKIRVTTRTTTITGQRQEALPATIILIILVLQATAVVHMAAVPSAAEAVDLDQAVTHTNHLAMEQPLPTDVLPAIPIMAHQAPTDATTATGIPLTATVVAVILGTVAPTR